MLLLLLAGQVASPPALANDRDELFEQFVTPPAAARPLAFWQWVNGNVTEAGIHADLAWMQRVGLGGVFQFEIGFKSPPVPQLVDRRVAFASKEWQSAVRAAASAARHHGLRFGAQSSGGWSVSGGVDVAPDDAMKKLVWSETILTPSDRGVRLAPLPGASGPFQDWPAATDTPEGRRGGEVAVLAIPLPDIATGPEAAIALPAPAPAGAARILGDASYRAAVSLLPDAAGGVKIVYRFEQAVSPSALTLAVDGDAPAGLLSAGDVGPILHLPVSTAANAPARTFVFSGATSREWTLRFENVTRPLAVREARFSFAPRVDRFEEKAGYGTRVVHEPSTGWSMDDQRMMPAVDISDRLAADGSIDWAPDRGRWLVLRFGWSLTGRQSVPATPESGGLEVDKLDGDAVAAFAERFYDRYRDAAATGGMPDIALTDSWEAGTQNWSPGLRADFERLRGYDPLPWFPALAGYVIENRERTERFLADWRRTIADLVADRHYAVFAKALRARGMTYFAEAPGTDVPMIADNIQSKSRVDVPMGEFWYWPEGRQPKAEHVADIREAASAAHLSGKPLVGAEALTTMGEAPWSTGPREWRRAVDRFFAEGVNQIVLHTSVHQPFTDQRRPGITLRQYGQHFTRNESWADLAGGWLSYLARSSFLLRQGRPVADIAVFIGEDVPLAAPHDFERPAGYDYDFVNPEWLLAMSTENGRLRTATGAEYRLLHVPSGVRRMSVPVLRKLRDFVRSGGLVVGEPPVAPIGLADSDTEFTRLVGEVWGNRSTSDWQSHVSPDLVTAGDRLDWKHRTLEDGDIYFLSNPGAASFDANVTLRPTAIAPQSVELWNAEDGSRTTLDWAVGAESLTARVDIPPGASRFLLIRSGAPLHGQGKQTRAQPVELELTGRWELEFLDGMGTPSVVILSELGWWNLSDIPAIRYYSGRAIYRQRFVLPQSWTGGTAAIDLGQVGDMARVRINGVDCGTVWWSPSRLAVTGLKPGENWIEVEVANYWRNRMIGDAASDAAPHSYSTLRPFSADDALRPAGLHGPVRLSLFETP